VSLSRLACVLAVAVASASAVLAAPVAPQTPAVTAGISQELAQHRAATLKDVAYDLHFRIPLEREAPVTGSAVITFRHPGDGPLVLDFADPANLRGVAVGGREVEYEAVHGHLVIPASALTHGLNRVAVEFLAGEGPLNRHGDFLYTLFVPARAHEVFPAFDQPDLKARFRLSLEIPAEWVAVANGSLVERRVGAGTELYTFTETEPLPTYLFSFAAGRFQVEEAERNGRAFRLFHRETDGDRVARNTPAIFELHATALAWLEDYTGIPYPFEKFDFVAVPAFQYNGMEHPGAVLYRAESLFLEEAATRAEELGRASLIAHETAHMWFGNLVTMPWFDDVWMKEVFANFMAARIVHPAFPDLDHELRFLLAHYPAAYGVDRTAGANPIRQELENLADAGSLYGAIIYQKAPIVMRHLEALVGGQVLQVAVRRYLTGFAFGNASWPDLVAALDPLTPLDVQGWSRTWIDEPGRPTVRVNRGEQGVRIAQEDPWGRGLVWEQPVIVRVQAGRGWVDHPVVLGREAVEVPLSEGALPDAPVLPNGAGRGYGLFLLDDATRNTLLRDLPTLPGALPRAVAWIGLHEMMLEGAVHPRPLLDLAMRVVAVEEDELVSQRVLTDLVSLFWRFLSPPIRGGVAGPLEALLWERMYAAEGASRKAALFHAWLGVATTPAAVQGMEALWAGALEVPGLPLAERDFTTLALQLATRDVPGARDILQAQAGRIENPDRRARFDFIRPAADPDPAVRAAFFASLAEPRLRAREEWVVAALQYLHHPLRADASVQHLRPALDLLREVRETGDIFFPTRWLEATLGGHASPEAAAIVRAFIAEQDGDYPPRLMEKLLQAADPLFRAAEPAR
jgi:aminopeptidase N